MKKILQYSFFAIFAFTLSCKSSINDENTYVLIETEFGNMKIKLYNETPKHKENFIKLINKGYYNDLIFHRIIKDFMIQGGDPDSKNAQVGKKIGNGGPGYTIPAEFNSKFFHKKGALSAARLGDPINPEKASSGSQFYIVQGKKYDDIELNNLEKMMNSKKKQIAFGKYLNENPELLVQIQSFQEKNELSKVDSIFNIVKTSTKYEDFKFSKEARKAYKEIGGTPFLDGEYTVFGEIVEGIFVIDKIAELEKDQNNRPLKNIKMKITVIK
jgi:cyclophilin family peptidyl-prolyl cis-trans isomerase